ncbi:PEP-CTERM sorting domain-containing protein [Oxalobacteraceae bacterium]|nr:PEP-CTERM sorting domain-containing protein [Oxalobacteraceae bacterium]
MSARSWAYAAAVLFSVALAGPAGAVPIDKYFVVNPIGICNNAGAACTTANTYAAQTQKIYAQAGVGAVFLPTTTINNTAALSVPSVTNLNVAGNGQHVDPATINMWFAQNMPSSSGTLFGEAYVGGNGVAINSGAVNSYNGGVGRMDTVAHELGHNFGLGHTDFGAGGANNLVTSGSVRNIPGSLGDITPDGANLDQLTAAQVTKLRSSPFMREVPRVTVDINGSTPFSTNNFFRILFNSGSKFLKKLSINLAPVAAFFDPTDTSPGNSSSPFTLSGLSGLAASDISVSGNTDGSQLLTLTFADNAFLAGDSFAFGIDMDKLACIDCFGATPAELAGSLFSFSFSDGFGATAAMSGSSFMADSTDIESFLPFDPSLLSTPPGFVAPVGILGPGDPVVLAAIPEPGSLLLILIGFLPLCLLHRRKCATMPLACC